MTNITRRQHYVWRYYLSQWATNEALWCLRTGKKAPFRTTPANVAYAWEFYKIRPLAEGDAEFIEQAFIKHFSHEIQRDSARQKLRRLEQLSARLRAVESQRHSLRNDVLKQLEDALVQMGEDHQSNIERVGRKHLDELVAGRTEFFREPGEASQFCYFLWHQLLRTKRIETELVRVFTRLGLGDCIRRCSQLLLSIFGDNLGYGLFASRHAEPLRLLKAPAGERFLTSDQPVMNLEILLRPRGEPPVKTEIFYPVSPSLAVTFRAGEDRSGGEVIEVAKQDVERLNLATRTMAHEQIFSASEEPLTPGISDFSYG